MYITNVNDNINVIKNVNIYAKYKCSVSYFR